MKIVKMQCFEDKENKLFEIWLSGNEADDYSIAMDINKMINEYKSKKYTVIKYIAGKNSISEDMAALLAMHRKRSDGIL